MNASTIDQMSILVVGKKLIDNGISEEQVDKWYDEESFLVMRATLWKLLNK